MRRSSVPLPPWSARPAAPDRDLSQLRVLESLKHILTAIQASQERSFLREDQRPDFIRPRLECRTGENAAAGDLSYKLGSWVASKPG